MKRPFEEIVAEHGATVLRVCRAVLARPDADDAWSETFLAALRAYPDLPADANVQAWLVTIAHRKAIDALRAEVAAAAARWPSPRSGDPALESEETDDLWTALRALPPKQRQAIALHHIAGFPYAEVAARTGGRPTPRAGRGRRHRRPASALSSPASTIPRSTAMIDALTRPWPPWPRSATKPWPGCTSGSSARRPPTPLDVAYRIVDSPLGPLLVAATEQGLVRLAYQREDHDAVLQTLADGSAPGCCTHPAGSTMRLDSWATTSPAAAGIRAAVDLRLSRGFRRQVLDHLRDHRIRAAGELHRSGRGTGHPKAVRAVGSACATNPIPIVVPCHRVLRSDGSLGG